MNGERGEAGVLRGSLGISEKRDLLALPSEKSSTHVNTFPVFPQSSAAHLIVFQRILYS